MTNLCGGGAVTMIKSEDGTYNKSMLSDDSENEDVPLKLRMKKMFDWSKLSQNSSETKSLPYINVNVKKEDEDCNSSQVLSLPSGCLVDKDKDERLGQEPNHLGKCFGGVTTETSEKSAAGNLCLRDAIISDHACLPGESNGQGMLSTLSIFQNQIRSTETNAHSFGVDKVNVNVFSLTEHPTLSNISGKVKVELFDNNIVSLFGEQTSCSAGADLQAFKNRKESPHDLVNDDLDHIVLKERQQMLLSRKLLEKSESALEGFSGRLPCPVDGEFSVAGSSCGTHQCSSSPCYCSGTEMNRSDAFKNIQESSSEKTSNDYKFCGGQIFVPTNPDGLLGSTSSSFVKAKVEPLDSNDLHNIDKNSVGEFSFGNIQTVKSESNVTVNFTEDEVDHMLLKDRIKLLESGEVSDSVIFRKCSNNLVPSAIESDPVFLDSLKPVTINRPRKRKKTATDSIVTALEEDAPGLLKVLLESGVSVDEIMLYGETESDDALDVSFNEENFAELEAVMLKLFSQRQSLLKFAPIRCKKSSKISYCLACLISLVEQTRYLRFRKWPVEWGWCRDLHSFIFVFERHNRIVLERPEYGYATYFFELVNTLPIEWQIKRLVTAMKLTICTRINLIENKALLVGEDLTEGEARILVDYGWIPNTGIGTMLNYRDRVFHDRQNDQKSCEWRSKIGKLLMDGHNGGNVVLPNIPKKAMECGGTLSSQIKLEL